MVYANWAELTAVEILGTDYRLPIRKNRSMTACLAIHGGAIEAGSSEVASGVAAYCGHNYYSVEGIKSANNANMKIPSTSFDEPQGVKLAASMDYIFSFHGMTDVTAGVAETWVTGLDLITRDKVITALQGAGFTVNLSLVGGDGGSAQNIVNENRRGMGVHIEMTTTLRESFFNGADLSRANRETGIRTETYYKYVRTLASVANSLGRNVSQTPNYGLNLALPTDNASDFETWINFNMEKLRKGTSPLSGATLPQSGPFNIGDRFYKTDTKSIYILVVKDANWGWHWRPIQDAISPWIALPATCLNLGTWSLNLVPAKPVSVAYDNRGKIYWRGVLAIATGTFARATSHAVFLPLPEGLRPSQQGVFMLGHETLAVGTDPTLLTCYQGARIFFPNNSSANPSIRGFGGTADFNKVHLTGVAYSGGTGEFTTV